MTKMTPYLTSPSQNYSRPLLTEGNLRHQIYAALRSAGVFRTLLRSLPAGDHRSELVRRFRSAMLRARQYNAYCFYYYTGTEQ